MLCARTISTPIIDNFLASATTGMSWKSISTFPQTESRLTCNMLGLSWDTAHVLMTSAVERCLERRETDNVKHVGIDVKSFGSGHSYVSVLTDTDQSRVLEVARDRPIAACEELWKTLTKPQLEQIESVSMDMWQAFMSSAAKHVPHSKIVHDKFHIAK